MYIDPTRRGDVVEMLVTRPDGTDVFLGTNDVIDIIPVSRIREFVKEFARY